MNGSINASVNLYEAKKDTCFSIATVPNIGLLNSLGLRVGTRVYIKNRYPLGGPLLLYVEDAFSVAIGKDIATQIAVKKVEDQ